MIIGFSLIVIISIIIGVYSLFNINKISSQTELIYLNSFIVSNSVKDININIHAIKKEMQDAFSAQNSENLNKSIIQINYHDSLINNSFTIVTERFLGEKQIIEDFYKTYRKWRVTRDEVLETLKNRDIVETTRIAIDKEDFQFKLLEKKAKFITNYAQNRANNLYQESIKSQKISSVLLIGGISFLLILSILIARFISKTILAANNELNKSEEKSRLILENSPDAIFIADQQGKYIYTNKSVTTMLGYSFEEMMNMTIADVSPPNRIEEYIKIFTKVVSKGKAFEDIELISQDGDYISVDLNAISLPDGMVYASCRDITNRKQREKDFKESESSLKQAQEIASMGSWDLDLITNEAKWSENCYVVFGLKPYEIVPSMEYVNSRAHPDDLHLIEETFNTIFLTGSAATTEARFTFPDKKDKWFYSKIIPIFQDGKIVKLKGIMLDINTMKMTELKLEEREKKLIELNADKDRFIAILGHDLKNPLNNLLGLSEILMEDLRKVDIDEIEIRAKQINSTVQKTNKLLEDILMWARTQQDKISFNPKISGFRDIYLDIIETLNPNADAKNITIRYSASDDLNIFVDIDMLKTVLRNLVSNAIKFTNNGGVITINAEENTGKVTISVSDDGIGIAPLDLKKLFNNSEFLSTKGTSGEAGTGLGLLLCKEFVNKHQGKIWIESEVGKGSKFLFTLPSGPNSA